MMGRVILLPSPMIINYSEGESKSNYGGHGMEDFDRWFQMVGQAGSCRIVHYYLLKSIPMGELGPGSQVRGGTY